MTKTNVVSFNTKSWLTKMAEYFDSLADKCCEVVNVKKAESVEYNVGIEIVFTTEYVSEYLSLKRDEEYNESAVNNVIDEVTKFFKAEITEEVAAKLGITSFEVYSSVWHTGDLANVAVSIGF